MSSLSNHDGPCKPRGAWLFALFATLMWIVCVLLMFLPLDKDRNSPQPPGPMARISFVVFAASIASAATLAAWQRRTGVDSKATTKLGTGIGVAFVLSLICVAVFMPEANNNGPQPAASHTDSWSWNDWLITGSAVLLVVRMLLDGWTSRRKHSRGSEAKAPADREHRN